MEQIEKVARAIDPQAWAADRHHMSAIRCWRRDMSMHSARAAIASLRELSDAMWLAGADTLVGGGENWRKSKFRRAWQAAIDTALRESWPESPATAPRAQRATP